MVGAAAMRQVAEDVSAHSAVKEGSVGPVSYVRKKWRTSRLRSAAEEVAKKNFPEEDRQNLTEAVVKAFENGELDQGLKEMSREEKQRYLLTTMQTMREEYLRSAAEEVAKRFPKEERAHLTEAVMKMFKNGELDKDARELFRTMQRLRELPVAASAVKFCSNLFREATQVMDREARAPHEEEYAVWQEAEKAAGICHKVLTGELGADDGPEWAKEAANSSQPNGQHLELGRLQKVNATEKAWKVSLKNVCKDECIELVKEMKEEAWKIVNDVLRNFMKPPSYEEVCAKLWCKRWKPRFLAVVPRSVGGTAELACIGHSSTARRKANGRPSAAPSLTS